MPELNIFDGVPGRVLGRVMAWRNRPAEAEAIGVLGPSPGDRVLAIGVGSGVGVALLVEHLHRGRIGAIDPSGVMVNYCRRRNRGAIAAGLVEVVQTPAHALPWSEASFDGALAVNSIHLWNPLEPSLAEVARVLRPGARLVTLTHDWAITRATGQSVDDWLDRLGDVSVRNGFVDPDRWHARAERGRSIAFVASRPAS